jgi:histone H3/H4
MSQPSTTTTTTTTTTGAPAAAVAAAAGAGESNAKRLKVEGDAAKDDRESLHVPWGHPLTPPSAHAAPPPRLCCRKRNRPASYVRLVLPGAACFPTDPRAPVPTLNKILKVVLPDATTSKEAKTGFQKAAGIFVMYVTACANDIAKENKRSTIQPSDVLAAM